MMSLEISRVDCVLLEVGRSFASTVLKKTMVTNVTAALFSSLNLSSELLGVSCIPLSVSAQNNASYSVCVI